MLICNCSIRLIKYSSEAYKFDKHIFSSELFSVSHKTILYYHVSSNLGSDLCIGRSVWKKFFCRAFFMRVLPLLLFESIYCAQTEIIIAQVYSYCSRTMLSGRIQRKPTTAVLLINYASS